VYCIILPPRNDSTSCSLLFHLFTHLLPASKLHVATTDDSAEQCDSALSSRRTDQTLHLAVLERHTATNALPIGSGRASPPAISLNTVLRLSPIPVETDISISQRASSKSQPLRSCA
jgi:hypothetical protein